jgi:hypothetical protein
MRPGIPILGCWGEVLGMWHGRWELKEESCASQDNLILTKCCTVINEKKGLSENVVLFESGVFCIPIRSTAGGFSTVSA